MGVGRTSRGVEVAVCDRGAAGDRSRVPDGVHYQGAGAGGDGGCAEGGGSPPFPQISTRMC